MALTDSLGDVNCRTPVRGRVPPLCASTPTDENNVIKRDVISSNWNINNNQYDCINKSRIDDKLFGTFQGTLGILDDIGDSCLIDSTIFNDTINNINCTHNTGQQQNYLTLIKQNSFEHDESLGILTPDQMTDFTVALGGSRTPSYENLTGSKLAIVTGAAAATTTTTTTTTSSSRLSRPTNVQFIGDDDLLCERSPSLEELPLDPKPLNNKLSINQTTNTITTITTTPSTSTIINTILPLTNILNASTSLLPMSFVTSVTSITSLEAGYQGDGENSRPASRGPDTSSSVQTVSANCKNCHLQDPMTDSDFFTESDADAHEDIVRGDRRAQIIDGTLFCPPTGRQYQNFVTEEMDSSGIYSDLDKKQDEIINDNNLLDADAIINNNINNDNDNINIINNDIIELNDNKYIKQDGQLPVTAETTSSSLSSIKDYLQAPIKSLEASTNSSIESILVKNNNNSDNNNIKIENKIINNNELPNKSEISSFKKYKMPKKYVASKIKAMIESNNKDESTKEQRRIVRTPRKPGRWTEVVKKIEAGKSEQRLRPQRKDVKSRIMQNIITTSSSSSSSSSTTPLTTTIVSVKKTSSSRNTNNSDGNKDKRTMRSSNNNQTIQETAQSSMSDISSVTAKNTVQKRSPQSSNQQRRLTNGRNNTTLKSRGTINDAKKPCPLDFTPITLDKSPTPIRKSTPTKRSVNNNNNQNSLSTSVSASPGKERVRRESHSSSPLALLKNDTHEKSAQTESSKKDVQSSENIIQALCLTIQYLNNQLEEYSLNAQHEIKIIKKKLLNDYEAERKIENKKTQELMINLELNYKEKIEILESKINNEKNEFEIQLNLTKKNLHDEYDNIIKQLNIKHENDLKKKDENININNNILTEYNPLLNDELTIIKDKYNKLKYCIKPIWKMKNNINEKLKNDIIELKKQIQDKKLLQKKITELNTQISELKKSNNLYNNDNSDITDVNDNQSATLHAEVWSLRSVLELQSQKNSSMRSEIDILRRDVEGKELLEQRIETLEARCEDLKAQLQCKESYERQISHQNEILLGSFHDVSKHNKRLTQRVEELQWRLRQKNEVVNVLANQLSVPPQRLSRSLGPEHIDHSLVQDKNNQQPTSSSMIKFMVQKGDSVSWTLEIDDTSDPLPNNDNDNNRNVTRHNSFRKTPRKKIDIRTRSKSVSTSDNINNKDNNWSPNYNSTPITTRNRQQNDNKKTINNDKNNNDNNNNNNNSALMPQEAGGEAMISEETSATSSEDESSASSDISRLAMDFEWSNSVE
ncbi:histone-lysine N-methyltransferase, H3 lysine-79 specific isoform X2 [Aphidius gifuensis]|nr:histone-lysine N-methyltransferase, H3 lysine-79 specific isoform X2 [Aphidius gifuensis]